MEFYHQMSKSKIRKTLFLLNELSEKFPMLKIEGINIPNLAAHYGLKEKDIKCTYVFIFFLKEKGAFISIEDIDSLKIRKKENTWRFVLKSSLTKKDHAFDYSFTL